MFEVCVLNNGEWWHMDYRREESQAKARCTKHWKKFGGDQEYRIRRYDARNFAGINPWLTGKTITPRAGEARIEWRNE